MQHRLFGCRNVLQAPEVRASLNGRRGLVARFARREEGQSLVWVAMCLTLILGFVGLALDVGQVLRDKRQIQTLADAAAFAGSLEEQQCSSGGNCAVMQAAVKQAMTENGQPSVSYTFLHQCSGTAGSGLTLTLNNGPCYLGSSDPNSGNTGYVEAVVTKVQATPFASLVGTKSMTLVARAEAGFVNSPFCVYLSANNTTSSANTALTFNSGAHFTSSCGVMDDSGAGTALMANSGAHISAPEINVHGSYTANNGTHFENASPAANTLALPDPLSWVPQPSVGSCTSVGPFSGKSNSLVQGTYCGFNINSGGSVTLNPGTYVFTQSVNIGSGATLSGSGVTLYFSAGTLQPNSGSTVDLSAPTSGTYSGILLYQSPNDTSGVTFDDGSKSKWEGAIYIPNASLTINSGGNAAAYTIVDAKSLIVDSGAKFTIGNDYSSLGGKSPVKTIRLVE